MTVFGQSAQNSIDYAQQHHATYPLVPCPNRLCPHDSEVHHYELLGGGPFGEEWICCEECECAERA